MTEDKQVWLTFRQINIIQSDTKKNGTFEKPNKNLRNPKKKKILTEIQPLQLAF